MKCKVACWVNLANGARKKEIMRNHWFFFFKDLPLRHLKFLRWLGFKSSDPLSFTMFYCRPLTDNIGTLAYDTILFLYLLHKVFLFNLGWCQIHPPQCSNSDVYHHLCLHMLPSFCLFVFNHTFSFLSKFCNISIISMSLGWEVVAQW